MMARIATTSSSSPTIRIRPPIFTEGKLDVATNYILWKFKISAILASYKLLDAIPWIRPRTGWLP